MRYKVGGKVVIKHSDSNWSENMDKWIGQIMTVRGFSHGGKYYKMEEDEGDIYAGWCWDDNMIDHEATAKLHSKTTTHRDRAATIGALVDQKSAQYGDAISAVDEVLRAYYPDGIAPDQYKNLGLIVRISDKLMRLANGHTEDTVEDIFGYLLLMMDKEDR